jgi:hypothetical protein
MMGGETSQTQKNQEVIIADLLAMLFEKDAKSSETHARLWAESPEKYGADAEAIGVQIGRAEAFTQAAQMIRNYFCLTQ